MSLLFCPQCGSELTAPDTETAPLRCPICGAALDPARDSAQASDALPIREAIVREEDDSATRAATREQLAPIVARATADHQRAMASAGQPTAEATQALPLAALPTDADSAVDFADAHMATAELPLSAQPVEPPDALERHSLARMWRPISATLAALVLLAVVVAAALAANGVIGGMTAATAQATPTVTVAPTATPPAFALPGLYQISHPQGWISQQRNEPPTSYYALLTAPTGNASVNIAAQQVAGAETLTQLTQLDQRYLDQLSLPGTTPTPSGAASSVTVGGQEWTQLTADLTLRVNVGQPAQYAHAVVLSTQRGAYAYTIVYLAPSPSASAAGPAFSTANQQYFQPMLASFTFLS